MRYAEPDVFYFLLCLTCTYLFRTGGGGGGEVITSSIQSDPCRGWFGSRAETNNVR